MTTPQREAVAEAIFSCALWRRRLKWLLITPENSGCKRFKGALWVKVVSNGNGARGPIGGGPGGGTSLQVSR